MLNKYDVHLHCMKVAKSCENLEQIRIAWKVLHRATVMLGEKFRNNNSDFFYDVIYILKGLERLYVERKEEEVLSGTNNL